MKILKTLYICELIFCIVSCFLCGAEWIEISFSNILSTYYAYFYLFVAIVLIWVEYICTKKISKEIYVTIGFIFVSLMYLKNIFAVNKSCFVLNIFCIINNICELSMIKNKKGTVNFPFLSYEEQREQSLNYLRFILSLVIIPYMLTIAGLKVSYAILCNVPYVLILLFISIKKSKKNELNKLLQEVNSKAMYKDFEAKVNEILKRDLETETVLYLLIIKTGLLLNYDQLKGMELYKSIRYPHNKSNQFLYNILSITYAEKENNYAMCHEILNKMNKTVFNKKIVSKLEKEILIRETFDTIDAIEKEFPINTEYKLQNIDNASLLAIYYEKQKNKEKAIYYANYVLSQKTDMEEFYNLANKVIEESKNY